MLQWTFGADHRPTFAEVGLGIHHTAWSLFYAGVTWLVYVALEPYARKIWPEIMVSWNRLIQGRWRDPLVGRDILVGLATGMVGGFLHFLPYQLAERLSMPLPRPTLNVSLHGLIGIRQSLSNDFWIPPGALFQTVLTLFVLLLLRLVLRKAWAAAVALCLIFVFLYAAGSPNPLVAAVAGIPLAILQVVILVRFGFLAAVAWAVPSGVGATQVHTWDLSAWYAGRAWFLLAVLAAVAFYAFRVSLAGRPVFRLLDAAEPAAGRGSGRL
jgi:serine/threonine-protein kinase